MKAQAEARRIGVHEATIVAIEMYADAATGDREFF
jgi:hypothetical protein